MSASIAFYAAFSMAPALLILVSLVRLIYSGDTTTGVQGQISEYVGDDAAELIARAVTRTTNSVGIGRTPMMLAIVTMLVGASAVFAQLLSAMNKVWRVHPKSGRGIRGILRDRFWPFSMFVVISALLFVSQLVSTFVQVYSAYVNRIVPEVSFVWHYFDLAFSFAIVTVLFALIYKFLPDARVGWRDLWVGAVVTAVFFSAASISSVFI